MSDVRMPRVRLDTARLRLTSPCLRDAARIAEYYGRNAEHLRPWEPPRPDDFTAASFWDKRLAQQAQERESGTSVMLIWSLCNAPDGDVIGACRFSNMRRGAASACSLGYSVGSVHQGQGFATEAIGHAVGWVLEHLGFHRIEAAYVPTNERSARLLKRLGFVVEGRAKNYIFIDGAWRDHVLTAVLNPEIAEPMAELAPPSE